MPWILEEEKALVVLKAAWDRGINTIDTSNNYSNGESEKIVGKFIKEVIVLSNLHSTTRVLMGFFSIRSPAIRLLSRLKHMH